MGSRLSLQSLLETILGTRNVYFQPPPSLMMSYPCIVYSRNDIVTKFGDNIPYVREKEYQVTVIDTNPDSLIPDKVGALPKCIFSRHYTAEGLNHDVFNLSY